MSRRTLLAATLLGAGFIASAHAQPVTGPYISLGGGGNYLQDERLKRDGDFGGKIRFDIGEAATVAFGYGYGNGFRAEVEGDFRRNDIRSVDLGYATRATGRQENYGGMLNGYFDLDIGSPYVYPYFGIGAGYSQTRLKNFSAVEPNTGFTVAANNTYNQGNFAYQAIFGLSFPVGFLPGLSLTAQYRFFSALESNGTFGVNQFYDPGVAGHPVSLVVTQRSTRPTTDYNHTAMIGLRYALFTPPPPPPPVPVSAQAAAPAPEPARTYLVFFDWDRADLTARARQIVAEAAQASTHVQTTRIEVNGYTDLSGTAAYNQKLSVRRAQSVQTELVRDGVSASEISIHGYGESNPLVQTAEGVREPQNRRVEIILK